MPTKREAFPSRFFKAADIPDNGLLLKIAKVEREKVGLDQELKWVVYFKGQEKQLVLNGTNWDLIAAALNEEDSDNWGGKAIEWFRRRLSSAARWSIVFVCVASGPRQRKRRRRGRRSLCRRPTTATTPSRSEYATERLAP